MKKIQLTGTLLSFALLVILLAACQGAAAPKLEPTTISTQLIATSVPTANLESSATVQPTAEPATSSQTGVPTLPPEQPASTPTQADTPPAPQTCADAMVFVDDVTIPDFSVLSPGQTFTKTWQVRNAGSCTWGDGYSLTFLSGELMAASKAVLVPTVKPGDEVNLSIPMIAPDDPGGYTGNWQILDPQGKPVPLVGSNNQDYVWIKLTVQAQAAASQPIPAPTNQSTDQNNILPVIARPNSGCASTPDSAFENAVLVLINQERTSRGLSPLKREARLDTAALVHSMDMSCNNFVEHYGSNGSTWFTRVKEAGYPYRYASENIAAGNPAFGGDAGWVVEIRWMNSQVHRENILNPDITEIGISYVFNSAAQWGGYTTVDFAQP